eukprot:6263981-Amphidinium_carterae.1
MEFRAIEDHTKLSSAPQNNRLTGFLIQSIIVVVILRTLALRFSSTLAITFQIPSSLTAV